MHNEKYKSRLILPATVHKPMYYANLRKFDYQCTKTHNKRTKNVLY